MSELENVLVVGAGPVGLVTALGLAREGVEVTVIDAAEEIGNAPRAMGYMYSVVSGLQRLGLLDDALRIGYPVDHVRFRVLASGESIDHKADVLEGKVEYPYFLTLGQDRLTEIVLDHLGEYENATVIRGAAARTVSQDEGGVTVVADTADGPLELRAGWVVGADGARSTVREQVGLEFEGMTWPDRFVATNVRYDFEARGFHEANQLLDPDHGAIVAKINREGLWRVTYRESSDLPEETVGERIPAFFAKILPDPEDVELVSFSPYRMHQRAAVRFREGRVLLAGDAAHVTNPIGGLGCTTGLLDAYVLFEALAAVISGAASEEVLDRYSEARHKVFWDVTSPTAVANKEFLYDQVDQEQLEVGVTRLREEAGDPERRLQTLLKLGDLVTPPLLAGSA
jgi:3-(3-hydroxy-phenyl)propionate hydroxylase/6-hydroxy-3-succinoylpyridine 3-monooxygenase